MAPWVEAASAQGGTGGTRKGLVFGGSDFLGCNCVSRLVERGDQLVVVNQEHSHWDNDDIKDKVQHFKCTRSGEL